MKLKNVKKWLNKNNVKYELWTMTKGDKALLIELPNILTEEYSQVKNKITKYINRYNGIYEFRGGYNFILIRDLI